MLSMLLAKHNLYDPRYHVHVNYEQYFSKSTLKPVWILDRIS